MEGLGARRGQKFWTGEEVLLYVYIFTMVDDPGWFFFFFFLFRLVSRWMVFHEPCMHTLLWAKSNRTSELWKTIKSVTIFCFPFPFLSLLETDQLIFPKADCHFSNLVHERHVMLLINQ